MQRLAGCHGLSRVVGRSGLHGLQKARGLVCLWAGTCARELDCSRALVRRCAVTPQTGIVNSRPLPLNVGCIFTENWAEPPHKSEVSHVQLNLYNPNHLVQYTNGHPGLSKINKHHSQHSEQRKAIKFLTVLATDLYCHAQLEHEQPPHRADLNSTHI